MMETSGVDQDLRSTYWTRRSPAEALSNRRPHFRAPGGPFGPARGAKVRSSAAQGPGLGPAGCLKAVWLKIFEPVFRGFRPEIDPGTPLDRRGSPGTSICTKKSAPEANSKAISWHPKTPARLCRAHREIGSLLWTEVSRNWLTAFD